MIRKNSWWKSRLRMAELAILRVPIFNVAALVPHLLGVQLVYIA